MSIKLEELLKTSISNLEAYKQTVERLKELDKIRESGEETEQDRIKNNLEYTVKCGMLEHFQAQLLVDVSIYKAQQKQK